MEASSSLVLGPSAGPAQPRDAPLWVALRTADGPKRAHLLGELARLYEPTIRRLARSTARQIGARLEPDDVLGAARVGFLRAAGKFDSSKGPFPVYVQWWVREEIQKAMRTAHVIADTRGKRRVFAQIALTGEESDLGAHEPETPPPVTIADAARVFVAERCVFGQGARALAAGVVAEFCRLAAPPPRERTVFRARARKALARELARRGARRVFLRTPQAPSARGWAGVRLAEAQTPPCVPERSTPETPASPVKLARAVEVRMEERRARQISTFDSVRIAAASRISLTTLRRWARGGPVHPRTELDIRNAAASLGISLEADAGPSP